jgi:peptidoglycan/xylan/chitin deacetylase (PgdA/CDA1 family)
MATATAHFRVETTSRPVAFITIDDGYFTDPTATAYVQANTLPVTMFLTYYAANQGTMDPPPGSPGALNIIELRKYQTGTPDQGRVGCHQKEHLDYRGQSVAAQQTAMTNAADWLGAENMFHQRPRLFRPPYGYWDDNTLTAAYNAAMTKLVLWTHAVVDSGSGWELLNEWGTPRVRAGDILLLHHPSSAENADGYLMGQLTVALGAIASANLVPAYLHDFL